MKEQLPEWNKTVREAAKVLPPHLAKTFRAVAYRADTVTHTVTGWPAKNIAAESRKRKYDGDGGVTARTIIRHLPIFEEHGVITVHRSKTRGRNLANQYHVDIGKVEEMGKRERRRRREREATGGQIRAQPSDTSSDTSSDSVTWRSSDMSHGLTCEVSQPSYKLDNIEDNQAPSHNEGVQVVPSSPSDPNRVTSDASASPRSLATRPQLANIGHSDTDAWIASAEAEAERFTSDSGAMATAAHREAERLMKAHGATPWDCEVKDCEVCEAIRNAEQRYTNLLFNASTDADGNLRWKTDDYGMWVPDER